MVRIAPSRTRRGRPPERKLAERRREEILAAATRHFARSGYHEADLQLLADELNVGKGTLYRYFPSKEALFLATAERVVTLMRAEIDASAATATDPLDAIVQAVVAYLRFFDAHPQFVEIIMLERSVYGDRRKLAYFAHRETNAGRWIDLYARLMEEGRVRRMPIDSIRDVIGSAVYGTMFTNYFAGRNKSLENQAAQIINVIFNGILTDGERASDRWKLDRLVVRGGES